MGNMGVFTKILAWVGTILAWSPILAVILGTILTLATGMDLSGMFRFDYVWPAALLGATLLGAALLLWAAFRARSRRRGLIGWSLAAALVLLIGILVLAGLELITGIRMLEAEQILPFGLVLALAGLALALVWVVGSAFAYILFGVGGILLLRDLYRQEPAA